MTTSGPIPWSLGDGYRDDPRYRSAGPERRDLVRRFHEDGVAVCRGLVPAALVAAAREAAATEFARSGRTTERKIDGAWRTSSALRAVAVEPAVLQLVEFLHGRRTIPFQTLTFRCGSEQAVHADSVHFDTIPSGWMCGVWLALEDVGPTQGPLRYVPGSHRDRAARSAEAARSGEVPYDRYEAEVAGSLDPGSAVTFEAEAGDVIVWAANLLHGGAPVADPTTTRWSQVSHYFFDGCTYVTPRASDPVSGRVAVRDTLIDLRTGARVAHVVPGDRHLLRVGRGHARLMPIDEVPSAAERGRSFGYAVATSIELGARAAFARVRHARGGDHSPR